MTLVSRASGAAVAAGNLGRTGARRAIKIAGIPCTQELKETSMTSKVVNSIDLPILHAGGIRAQSRVGERMDLVEHVKVRVTVSLGETEIPISQLFALGGGDVLTLDREADAPVDMRVNDRLIARGVLVAVGDQFGVRITEIEAK